MHKTLSSFEKQTVKGLRVAQKNLRSDLARINAALQVYEPPVTSGGTRVREALSVFSQTHTGWSTMKQLREGTKMSDYLLAKELEKLVKAGDWKKRKFSGVVHYQRVSKNMTLRAGYGEMK